jgi:anionic cell wall polymer biosynthesis LytR-Cps2A-Psr (LCP) family protein
MDKLTKAKYFLLAFALSFFVFSVLLLTLMNAARPGGRAASPAQDAEDEPAYVPAAEDSLSVLFIGGDSSGASTFLLARFDPAGRRVALAVFPADTAVMNAGKTESLADVYRFGGAGYVRDRLALAIGAPIDRYVLMPEPAFLACASAIGTVEFELAEQLTVTRAGVTQTLAQGKQLLDGQKAADIIGGYPGGELARCRATGELAAAIIDQRRDICASVAFESVFEKLVNLINTDISSLDFHERRDAAEYMAKLPDGIAMPISVSGSYSADDGLYHLSDTFLALLSQTMR